MKVLFVISGNSKDFKIAPFVKAQSESLQAIGIEVEYFSISKKGIIGYFHGGLALKKFLKGKKIDLVHAHYVLSGFSAVIGSGKTPVVLSLMGSDAYGEYISQNKVKFLSRFNIALTYIIQPFVKAIICKSKFIESFVYQKKASQVIPNGVDLNLFNPENKVERGMLGLSKEKKYILFLGDTSDTRKNFRLAQEAIRLLNDPEVELLKSYPVNHEEVPFYINAADVLISTSYMEGSSNVIKEAMACNCPVVATNVGDVQWLFGNEPGYFITEFEQEDAADKIKMALTFSEKQGRTEGRKRIIELNLDAESVAKKIIALYKNVILNNKHR